MTDSSHAKGPSASKVKLQGWLVDLAAGGVAGLLLAAVVAVNFVIFIGVERGYESSIAEVFEHSLPAGIITLMILVAGPIAGVFVARHRRASRGGSEEA